MLLAECQDIMVEQETFIADLQAEIENARRSSEYWKAEHATANAEIEKLNQIILEQRTIIAKLSGCINPNHQVFDDIRSES